MTAKKRYLHSLDCIERHFTVRSYRFKEITKKRRCVTSTNAKRTSIKINAVLQYHMEA